MANMQIGIQLYTVREPLQQDFKGTIEKLSAMGITGVELAFFYGNFEPEPLASLMKSLKIKVCGIYEHFQNIHDSNGKVYEYAKAVGCKYLTSGLPEKELKENFESCVAKCKDACKVAASKGMKVCYHAHAYEFENFGGGIIMDRLLDAVPEMLFEADTAWIKNGGLDPAHYIKKRLARIPLVHFKDVKADKSITELGSGIVDFPAVLQAIKGSSVEWISYEQDTSSIGALESTRVSMEYLRGIMS